ncbi:hypothetical protein PRUPE_6G200500 [Prunus persica]|uniref:DUF4408 domain-containing protein n=1 Tax=Prunus persica TaxID=3760 RepID=A0A251NT22_PRUPE|nr:hypothetical protein PRUPE_6G200500 [Prunus persica]
MEPWLDDLADDLQSLSFTSTTTVLVTGKPEGCSRPSSPSFHHTLSPTPRTLSGPPSTKPSSLRLRLRHRHHRRRRRRHQPWSCPTPASAWTRRGKKKLPLWLPLVKNSGFYFQDISGFVVSPRFVFVVGNIIVIILLVKSGKFSGKDSSTGADLYDEFVHNSEKNHEMVMTHFPIPRLGRVGGHELDLIP